MQAVSRVLTVVACLAVTGVLGHAVIVSPPPFNVNPSKSFGCGGASGGPLNVIAKGGTLNWRVVASDGTGAIRMLVDPAGGSGGAFPNTGKGAITGAIRQITLVPLGDAVPTLVNVPYLYNFTWPADLTCTGNSGGSNSVCTVQVASESNWVSCFSFTKTAPATAATSSTGVARTEAGACVTITASTGLSTCNMLVGKTVWVPQGTDVNEIDVSVRNTIVQNINNVAVFWNHQSPDDDTPCRRSYTDFLCAQAFVPCNTAKTQPTNVVYGRQPCQTSCREFTCWCDLTQQHAFLYECSGYQNQNVDSTGMCSRKKYGPSNSTCVPRERTDECENPDDCAAPHAASLSPYVLAAAVATAVAALYAHN